MTHTELDLQDTSRLAYEVGTGQVRALGEVTRLTLGSDASTRYSDAQLDDYHIDGVMRWQAPLHLQVRARFSHTQAELRGTAGFGFWNDPFGMTRLGDKQPGWRRYRLPQAVWFFFASPPSNMGLASGVPGFGWKAATIDASSWLAKALLPLSPLGMLACRVPAFYKQVWPFAQRILKIEETWLPTAMNQWHDYEVAWRKNGVQFLVDGKVVLQTRVAPRGLLGFVAWMDNQFMVATPQGEIRNGVTANSAQWLELEQLRVRAE